MCVLSLDGCFKRVNPTWESCLGWRGEELLATPFLDLVRPGDRAATATELGRLAAGAATIAFENRCRGKDGADRWLLWNAICRPERQLIYATARDVTGRKRLEREIIEAGDREKERIGRDLHDGLCQNLGGIAALSASLARQLAARADPAAAAAGEIAGLLNQAIGDARDLARGLDPAGLAQLGLAAVLDALATNIQVLHRITCSFAHDRHFPRLETAVEAHLYRIAQQAVNNAIVHGRAKRIAINLRLCSGKGRLRVQDNGFGMPQAPLETQGIGLHTMERRARLIGASLQLQRVAPRGTAVVCTFVVAAAPKRDGGHADKPT